MYSFNNDIRSSDTKTVTRFGYNYWWMWRVGFRFMVLYAFKSPPLMLLWSETGLMGSLFRRFLTPFMLDRSVKKVWPKHPRRIVTRHNGSVFDFVNRRQKAYDDQRPVEIPARLSFTIKTRMGWVLPLKQTDKIPSGPFLNIPRGKGANSPSANFAVLSRLQSTPFSFFSRSARVVFF